MMLMGWLKFDSDRQDRDGSRGSAHSSDRRGRSVEVSFNCSVFLLKIFSLKKKDNRNDLFSLLDNSFIDCCSSRELNSLKKQLKVNGIVFEILIFKTIEIKTDWYEEGFSLKSSWEKHKRKSKEKLE